MADRFDMPPGVSGVMPGQRLARGVCRHLSELGHVPMTEFVPARGLRVDVIALGPQGQIWIVECKSGIADYRSDQKWHQYLDWCDQYFWAISPDFPRDILPADSGIFLADAYGAELLRQGPERRLAPARRRSLTQAFARQAGTRLMRLLDPLP